MSKLKQKKYFALLLIIGIVLGLIGLFSYGKIDKFKGLVKVKNLKLQASIANTSSMTVKGTEEINYVINYTLDEVEGITNRDVIIKATINSDYAKFKEINKDGITNTLNNDGKEIEINIENVPLGEEQELKLKLQVTNAPNNESIVPQISIKESTGEFTNVTGEEIKVETNSVEGLVYDENNTLVPNIELSINKNGKEVKRTYTTEDGRYVFSDLEAGDYVIKVEEDIYEIVSGGNTSESNPSNIIKVKTIDKFDIETHKYIEKLDLVINGQKKSYTYQDAKKVIESVKNAKTVSGQIEYKLVVRNKGVKNTEIVSVEDEPSEGLEFKASNNTGWTKEGEIIKYKPIEGVVFKSGEKREIKLVLDITNTEEIKTYINKLTTRGEIKEKIVFIIDGEKYRELTVTEGEVIDRPDFDIDDLDGWYTDVNYTNKYKFSNRVNKDLILYAKTHEQENEYTVRYIDNNSVVKVDTVKEGEKTTKPADPTKTGYTFECWKLNNNCYDFNSEVHSDIDLISSYSENIYSITYDLDGGEASNPDTYKVTTTPFTLNAPTKTGYTFIGWTGSNGTTPSLLVSLPDINNLGDKEYTANYSIDSYTLTINPNGGTYQGETSITKDYGTIITINTPTRDGYTFDGWTLTGKGTYNNGLYTFGDGDGTLTANYTEIEYTVTYKGLTEEEEVGLHNPGTYKISTTPFTLNNPADRLNEDNEGEVFVGWKEKDAESPSMNITLPDQANLGNKEYTAIWNRREPDKWNITYDYGNPTTTPTNPSTYKRSELPITLNEPTKTGYDFIGWTGSNGNTPESVTIPRGTTGDLNYIANYLIKNYNITYDYTSCNLTPEEITTLNNKTSYKVEDSDFNLNNPNKYGYVFTGWTGTDLVSKTINVTVDTSKAKTLNYIANCDLDNYDVEFYNYNGNDTYNLETTVSDIEYNTKVPANKIPDVSLLGYTFRYWSLDKVNEFDFNTPITEDTKLYAVYQKTKYTISYNLNGGSATNPEEYYVDTPSFTLNEPTKTGYEFIGWTGSNGDSPLKVITLPDLNNLGNKQYTANYEVIKYRVTFMNGEVEFDHEDVEHNKKATIPANSPSKAHNIFLGWTLNGVAYDFETPVTAPLTLYASWEEVEEPTITHTPTTWVGDKVTVTITSDHDDYTYMYKVGNGSYQEYNGPFDVTENTTVYAYSVKNNVTSTEVSHEIDNIDKINPSVNSLTNIGLTPVSATIKVNVQDLESGANVLKIYVDDQLVFENPAYTTDLNEEKELEYTVGNLEQVTTYTIKAEITDKVGNVSYDEIEVTTTAKHYVARTLSNDGTEIEKYETLKEAIESSECVSTCHIQMLDDVEETNSVLDGQDIKLDLNGFEITGLTDKAIENNGILQIVDYNEDEIGKIYSTGTAIVNTGKLIIGENEEELSVSKTEPIIEGLVNGINSTGQLHFYDGKIIGDETSGAFTGSAPITPYSYNASVDTSGGKEIATLEIVAEAEARINSVYYTKVQEAVDASKNGSYVQPEGLVDITSQVKSISDYNFVYDETTGTLVNNNQGVSNSVADSYIFIDTKGETYDKVLSIDTSINSETNSDYGYIHVTNSKASPSYDDETDRYIIISGEATDNVNILLEKNKEYYIHIGYSKDNRIDSGTDTFTINSIKLSDYVTDSENDMIQYMVSENGYHFKKLGTDYLSNTQGIDYAVAHSYIKVDMTGKTDAEYINIDATVASENGDDVGYIAITDSSEVPDYSEVTEKTPYLSGPSYRNTYVLKLIPNEVNYIHFVYAKDRSGSYNGDTFTIHSVKLADEIFDEMLPNEITPTQTYYMYSTDEVSGVWSDLSNNGNDGYEYNTTWSETDHSLVFNGSDSYVSLPEINPENITVRAKFMILNYQSQFVIGNYEGGGYGIYVNASNQLVGGVYANGGYKEIKVNDVQLNTLYDVTLTYDGSVVNLYVNGVKQTPLTVTEDTTLKPPTKNTHLMLGTNPVRNEPYNQYFNGKIYDIKVYDKAQTETEINNTSTDQMIIHLDGTNHVKHSGEYRIINNNQGAGDTQADSYMVFDLTNIHQAKNIYVNAEVSSERNYDYGYVIVTDSPNTPDYSTSEGKYVYIAGDVSADDYRVVLQPETVNYVHFGYRKDGGGDNGTDTFTINSIRYYEDTNRTIPVYIFGNQTSKMKPNIVPVINQNPDTVQILRNITMTTPLDIIETRNVILDLNGYTLTTSQDEYVIDNKGSLKIIDTDYQNQIDTARENYEREQAEYDREYEEELVINQAKYEEDVQKYNDFKNDYKEHFVENFNYTGSYQEFTAPTTGTYKIEAWGAQGGTVGDSLGGKGAYTSGQISLTKGQKIYIYVGGQPKNEARQSGGYNGGGNVSSSDDGTGRAGGGSTDIRLVSGDWSDINSLASRIMVAAGGGGSACEGSSWCASGGAGGALTGLIPTNMGSSASGYYGTGGTQTSGGTSIDTGSYRPSGLSNVGTLGKGGDSASDDDCGSGGSGYYGGGGSNYASAGGGGSSYISGYKGSIAIKAADNISPKDGCLDGTDDVTCSYHYSGIKFNESVMIPGNEEMPAQFGTGTIEGNSGNGFARIELIDGDTSEISDEFVEGLLTDYSYNYEYTGSYQEFIAPIKAKYKIEAWGGSGSLNAYGGYTSGEIELEKGEKLYIYVGNKWTSGTDKTTFNGGTGNQGGYNGGSSTDIRLVGGSWDDQTSLASRIMVAGAGGSGDGSSKNPGAGGGLIGYTGGGTSGGTQTEVGSIESTSYTSSSFGVANGGCTGGSGYYPGSGASCVLGAGGGSSFISGHKGSVAVKAEDDITPKLDCETGTDDVTCSYHYSGKVFTNTKMVDGEGYKWSNYKTTSKSGMPTIDGTNTMVGNDSAGAVKITIASPELQQTTRRIAKLDTNQTINGNVLSTTNSVILNDIGGYLEIETGNVTLDRDGSYDIITNKGTLKLDDEATLYGKKESNRGINNAIQGDIITGSGNIVMEASNNIGIINSSGVDSEINGYTITNYSTSSTNFVNEGKTEMTVKNLTSNGTGVDVHQNSNINLTVKDSSLNSTYNESYYSNTTNVNSTVTFDNCTINSRIYNREGSVRTIVVKDSDLVGNGGNIYNRSGTVNVNDSNLTNSSLNIRNMGTMIIRDSEIINNNSSNWSHNIENGEAGDENASLTIYDSNLTVNDNRDSRNLYSYGGTATFDGCVLNTTGQSIYNGTYYYGPRPANVNLIDTTINKTGNNDYSVVYNYYGDLVIDGGEINTVYDDGVAVYNEEREDSHLTIKGDFSNSANFNRGVQNYSNFTLGENDSTVSKTNPLIRGTVNAIYSSDNATFNYYDGKLIGPNDNALSSAINDIAPQHDIYVTKGDTLETIILKTKAELDADEDYVARIGNNYYSTIQSAFDTVPATDTETEVVLLKDLETDALVAVDANKNILFNYDGHTIKSYNEENYITNNGTLKLVDANTAVNNKTFAEYLFINNGTLNYNSIYSVPIRSNKIVKNNQNATFNMNGGEIYSYQTGLVVNDGTFNFTGGKIYTTNTTAYGSGSDNLIINDTNGVMTVSGGSITFIGLGSAIYNKNQLTVSNTNVNLYGWSEYRVRDWTNFIYNDTGATANVTGGTYGSEVGYATFMKNKGTATITGVTSNLMGSIINNGTATLTNVTMDNLRSDGGVDRSPQAYMYNNGTLTISGGSYKGTTNNAFLICEGSSINNISDTKLIKNNNGDATIDLRNSSTLTISDTEIKHTTDGYNGATIRVLDSSSASLTNCIVSNTGQNRWWDSEEWAAYGIYHRSSGSLSLTNTDVTSYYHGLYRLGTGTTTIKGGSIISSAQYGIYNIETGTITIGEKGGVPSKTNPEITGDDYGLYSSTNDAVINFYDGIISGDTAIQAKINEIEPNYEIILDTDTKEHKYLDRLPVVKNARTTEEFYTIQDAFDDPNIQSGDTIEVLREVTILPDAAASTVGSTQNIVFDLKGYKITTNNAKFIVNNGTFKVKTSVSGGRIESNGGLIFENTKDLTIDNGSYNTTSSTAIFNNHVDSSFNINDGDIYAEQSQIMINDGELNMFGGKMRNTRTNRDFAFTSNMIENTGIVNVSDCEFDFIGSGSVINNSNKVVSRDVKVELYGRRTYDSYGTTSAHFTNYINNNTSTADATINGGEYGASGKYGRLAINDGILRIDGVISSLYGVIINNTSGDAKLMNSSSTGILSPYRYTDTYGGIYNAGLLEIDGVELDDLYMGESAPYDGLIIYNVGSFSTNNVIINKTDSYYSDYKAVVVEGSGTSSMDNTEITINDGRGSIWNGVVVRGSANLNVADSRIEFNNTSSSEREGAFTFSGSGTVNIERTDVIANGKIHAINKTGTGTLNFKTGSSIADTYYGLYNTGTGTINIGVLGGTVSKVNPEIKGNEYGLYSSNNSATINFYDGIITGATAIYGTITDVEPTYEIIQKHNQDDSYSKYLDQVPLVRNTSNNDEFNTIQDAIADSNFTNGDTLELLRELTTLPSYTTVTIPSGTNVTIDMKGYKIIQNNSKFFVNNGILTITDSTQTPGSIQTFNNTIIENNGTLTVENVKLYTESNISKLLDNKTSSTATLTNVTITSPEHQLIDNDGTLTITGGNYKKTNSANQGERYCDHLIVNDTNGNLTVTNATMENKGDGSASIYNKNIASITGGSFLEKGGGDWEYAWYGHSNSITNESTGTITVDGSSFTNSQSKGRMIANYGTATIDNATANLSTLFNTYSGTLTINNINAQVENYSNNISITNNSSVVNIIGGSITVSRNYLLYTYNSSTLNVSNVSFTTTDYGMFRAEDDSEVNVTGGTYTGSVNGLPDSAMFQYTENSSGTISNPTVNTTNTYNLYTYGTSNVSVTGGSFTSNIQAFKLTASSEVNVTGGNINSTASEGIYLASSATLTYGTKGGIPNNTVPSTYGKTYGINHIDTTSTFNFYDGVIKGETGSISGTITSVEDGYKEKRDNVTDPDTGITTIDSTLTVVGDTERVAMVNGVNFLSLQSAVNYASNNNIEAITLFKSVTLTEDLVKPASGGNVKIYLNGNTITQGSYNIDSGITIVNSTPPSASLTRFLANITGTEINPRNIVIYQMDDGSELESIVNYKLYKIMDGELKVVKVKERSIGEYDLGNNSSILRTVNGKIYINEIGEGSYRLVGSDNKEINFEITYEGISNNIRENNRITKNRTVVSAATLILQLQTGVARNPYILIVMILIVIILGVIAYKKYKEDYEN